MPGRAKPNIGAMCSHSTAASQNNARTSWCMKAPASQHTAEIDNQPSMCL